MQLKKWFYVNGRKNDPNGKPYYILGSRIFTHISFWIVYFLVFGFIWVKDGDYRMSYFLEFVLLPARMIAVYTTLYVLVPQFLKRGKNVKFIAYYLIVLGICSFLQRMITYGFYEWITVDNTVPLLSFHYWLRGIILINSTVLFLLGIKIVVLWQEDQRHLGRLRKQLGEEGEAVYLAIRSDNRNYKVLVNSIFYVEGLGNYVSIHLPDQKIVSYHSLKDLLEKLPSHFVRIHKSFIINTNKIQSYSNEDVDINGRLIPIGRSFKEVLERL